MSETSRRHFLQWLSVIGASAALPGTAAASENVVVIRHATLIDGTDAPPQRDVTIVLVGDRVVYVGHRAVVPDGAQVVDARGKYVIPGLWDMHTHYAFSEDIFIPLYIANGVTGIREMWGYAEVFATHRKIESGELLGPRMHIAGALTDGPHSVWAPMATIVANEAEARAAARQARADGGDFIKAYSYLSDECIRALISEGRSLGMCTAGHLPWRLQAGPISDAGMRSFEHLYGMPIATSADETEILRQLNATPIDPANPRAFYNLARELDRVASLSHDPAKALGLYERFVRNNTWQSPTLTVLRVMSSPADTFARDPRLRYFPGDMKAYWAEAVKNFAPTTPQQIRDHRAFLAFRLGMVREMARAGVGIIGGTDCGNPYTLPGFGSHDELSLLVSAGLSEKRALQTMTRDAARFMGVERTMGTVAPGKVADLVVLDADPLRDIRNSAKVHAVVARGRLITSAQREKILRDVEEAANKPPKPELLRSACGCHVTGTMRASTS